MDIPADSQAKLVAALRDPARFGPECGHVRQIETHISYVLLTGAYAYKIKKAIRLGFLDFTTLAQRRFYCDEELRLNRRLAPAVYLDVVAITGSVESPQLGGTGPVLDYAVRMREFPQAALLSNVLAQGGVTPERIEELAAAVAKFHGEITVAPSDSAYGRPDDVRDVALANFAEIRSLLQGADDDRGQLERLEAWTRREYASRQDDLALRRRSGFVRECHGDLHLGNVALIDDAPVVFDCIEFNDRMRWIDVMSEVAFTVMDLDYRGHLSYARRFLNAYLEATGDYSGVGVLRFYLVYRAMVRAKVAFLRASQVGDGDKVAAARDARDHLRLARAYAAEATPAVIVTHGFAGSGKTTASQALLERIGAIRLRTDVERKRLHGLAAQERSRSGLETGLYAPDETRKTYDRLRALARVIVASGFPLVVDGAFLLRWQRASFRALAAELRVPFIIVDVCADENVLRKRVEARAAAATDASEAGVAVLSHQLRTHEPLDADERGEAIVYDAGSKHGRAGDDDAWRALVERLRAAAAIP